MYLVPLFKCNAIVFTLHLRGGVKGIIVIAPSLGFGGILLYSIYAQRASLNRTDSSLSLPFVTVLTKSFIVSVLQVKIQELDYPSLLCCHTVPFWSSTGVLESRVCQGRA